MNTLVMKTLSWVFRIQLETIAYNDIDNEERKLVEGALWT